LEQEISLHVTVLSKRGEHHEVPRSSGQRGRKLCRWVVCVYVCVRTCVYGVRRWAAGSLPGLCRRLGRVCTMLTKQRPWDATDTRS
jgi:hypothetical protein